MVKLINSAQTDHLQDKDTVKDIVYAGQRFLTIDMALLKLSERYRINQGKR